MKSYSDSFKQKMVQRMLLPNGPSASALSRETGVPQPTLSMWKRDFSTVLSVSNKKTPGAASGPRRPEEWSAQERLRAVSEASRLSQEELGEFLRREGLHEETLLEWQQAALAGLAPAARQKRSGDVKRIKELEREVARKDKALAEAAALLVLKKKVQAIWGDEDDDTNEETDK